MEPIYTLEYQENPGVKPRLEVYFAPAEQRTEAELADVLTAIAETLAKAWGFEIEALVQHRLLRVRKREEMQPELKDQTSEVEAPKPASRSKKK